MGKDAPNEGDYVWGRQVALIEAGPAGVRGFQTLPQIKPGDIVQFRHVRIEGFNHEDLKRRYWLIVEHHTAVVVSVDAGPAVMKVCHQNWGPKKEVRQDTLYLADLVQGWLRIYRPQAKPPPAGG